VLPVTFAIPGPLVSLTTMIELDDEFPALSVADFVITLFPSRVSVLSR